MRWRFFGQAGLNRFQSITCDFNGIAVLPGDEHAFGAGFQNQCRENVAVVRVIGQRLINPFIQGA